MSCKIIAHRGANQYAPQNTLPAFQKAIALGADGLETDVHLTKDGKPVICHNYSIDETSNGLGRISEYTLKDLKSLDFGASFSRKYRGTPLPSLDEFLEMCQCSPLTIMNIELKSPRSKNLDIVHKTIEATKRYNLMDKLLISSFDADLLAEAKTIDPECKTALLYPYFDKIVPYYFCAPFSLVRKIKADAVHPHHACVNPFMVKTFHRMGVKVNPWTINQPTTVYKMLNCGVDGMITDRPRDVADLVKRHSHASTEEEPTCSKE